MMLMILISALTLNAQNKTTTTFTVKGITDGPVMIDGKEATIGLKFTDRSKIKWTSPDQQIQAWNGKKLLYFLPVDKQMNKQIKTSLAFTSTNNLSIRRDMPISTAYHNNAFQQIDTLEYNTIILTGWEADRFTISFTNPADGKTIEHPIDSDGDYLLISPAIFEGITIAAPTTITARITYTNPQGKTTDLTPWTVTLLPDVSSDQSDIAE